MTEIISFQAPHPERELKNSFRLKPSQGRGIIFGFMLRLLVAIFSVAVPVVILMIVGFFNGWKLTTPLMVLFSGFVCLSVFFGEHLRSRAYERSISVQPPDTDAIALIEKMEETAHPSPQRGEPILFLKGMIDIVLAISSIFLLAPLFLVAAVIVKTSSPGPLLSRTQHLGLRRRMFRAYKFRTTVENSEAPDTDAVIPLRDPGVTAVGDFMRKSGLDELPFLFSVLVGDMSLVGPSLLSPADDAEVTRRMARFGLDRHSARPGLINIAAINRPQSDREISKIVKAESAYLRNWSLWLDFLLTLKAIPRLLRDASSL
jgi:lipopolysaccharide/colanic/teichoic acid biosynthesis glycosyltransferase